MVNVKCGPMRTFIAIPVILPEGLLQARRDLIRAFGSEGFRWTDLSLMHITVRFFGETSEQESAAIARILQSALSGEQAFCLDVGALGYFTDRNRHPVVLWASFNDWSRLSAIRKTIDSSLDGLMAPEIHRRFKPHLTIARMRGLPDVEGFKKQLQFISNRNLGQLPCNEVVYFKSILRPEGPEHQRLKSVELLRE